MSDPILARAAPPADLRVRYGTAPAQFADLRVPAGPGPFPCVIGIHGGFWRAAYDLEHFGNICAALTHAGIATWNIEYRRVGEDGGGWPGTFLDVAAAARALVDLAPLYGMDLERIVLLGHSAGGHLASWLASAGRIAPGSEIAVSAPVLAIRGVVPLAGVLDLRRAFALDLSAGATRGLLGGGPDGSPERYAAASPVELVPSGVPHVVIHGEDDDIVPSEFSERYVEATQAAGDDARLVRLAGVDHFDIIDPLTAAFPVILTAIRTLLRR